MVFKGLYLRLLGYIGLMMKTYLEIWKGWIKKTII